MRYVDALKIWNESENNGKWCFPSKGTESHKQIIEIMRNGGASKKQIQFKIKQQPKPLPKKKRIIKVKKKQVGGFAEGFRGDFKSQYNWDDPRFAQDLKNYKQQGNGMDDEERNLRIRSMFKNTYGQDALNNYDKQTGNGLILPGRQQRGRGGDLPWDVILDIAQNPMSYVNKAGKFLDSTSGTKQMAEQIERETGAKRLFRWPWEN